MKRKSATAVNCCPICEDEYQEENIVPVILVSCGHTICRKCAKDLEKHNAIACPTCRTATKSTAAELPKNFALFEALHSTPPTGTTKIGTQSKKKSTNMEEAKEVISKLSDTDLAKVHKTIAEDKMKDIVSKIKREQEEFNALVVQIEGKKGQVAKFIAQINKEIKPLHESMRARVTSIQNSATSLTTICKEANAKIAPNQPYFNQYQNYYYNPNPNLNPNNLNLAVAPHVVVPVMPQGNFVGNPQFY